MNRKAKIEMSVGTLVTIVLLMAILLLMVKMVFGNSAEYKIEKEVCWNEYELKGTFDLEGRQIPYEELCSEIDCGKRQNITLEIKNESKEVCEMQEVDEIRTWQDPTSGVSPVNCSNLNEGAEGILNSDGFFCKDEIVQRRDIYSKEDLTKEWLNENAECVEGKEQCEGVNFEPLYQKWDYYGCKYTDCTKWKLGDYYVSEVKK